MHTDRKIGFAMGILLIGIVAALFFRNEPLLNPDLPTVRREHELNERLRERDVAVYLSDPETSADAETAQAAKPKSLRDALKSMSGRKDTRTSSVPKSTTVAESPDDEEIVASPDDEIVPIPGVENVATKEQSSELSPVEAQDSAVPIASIPSDTAPPVSEPHDDAFQPPTDFEEYVVKYGDTLSGIAQRFLGSQSRYKEIYEANRDRMSSPDRLDVGKPLRIPRVASGSDSGTH